MYDHEPNCKCRRCKPDSDQWCAFHQCEKTWMISSSFCPKCEEAKHGEKGKAKPQEDPIEQIFGEIDLELDPKAKFEKIFCTKISCWSMSPRLNIQEHIIHFWGDVPVRCVAKFYVHDHELDDLFALAVPKDTYMFTEYDVLWEIYDKHYHKKP